eukprot:TRINITY_DN11097_c0_g1_i1.p1 TRINITY_DN11097_c0_g1~~TRINITY_DN11097_c0_g1_i1.p1  ORF type:complete len:700 (+),score=125.71 TRINITY_DN11097_c0_g1_i1:59-2101(+)
MAADLEGFERAFRLRSCADDGLLKQIFGGEEKLKELSEANPALLETARTYFPHLTSFTYDKLMREPSNLQVEKDRCDREMEQLAVQHYGAFIGNARVTRSVRHELSEIQTHLDGMTDVLGPFQDCICDLKKAAADVAIRRTSLRNVLQQHGTLVELLELPQHLDACVRNQMYDESLELLAHCATLLKSHEVDGNTIPVLRILQEQVAVQRANLHASLIAQLKTDIHLPACVRIIGFMRRIQRHSEDELRQLFIEHRGSFLEVHKQQKVDMLRSSRGSIVAALRNAADLLRTHVYDIGTQYRALFPQEDGPLSAWLNEQIMWLIGILRAHVMPPSTGGSPSHVNRGLPGSGASPGGGLSNTVGTGRISGSTSAASAAPRIDAASLNTVLKQCLHASSTLKRLGGHFFPSVAGIFETRMDFHVCELLDFALLTYQAELGRYDWVPSTALSGTAGGASAAGAGQGWLHPQALDLTRHRPLAVFTNDIVQMFNELRQCAMCGLRASVVLHTFECLMAAIKLMKAVKMSPSLQPGSPKANELLAMCENFSHILLPLVAAHLEAVFGVAAKLDVSAITAAMVPDLLPSTEATDDSALLAESDLVADANVEDEEGGGLLGSEEATNMDGAGTATEASDVAATGDPVVRDEAPIGQMPPVSAEVPQMVGADVEISDAPGQSAFPGDAQ